LIALPVQVPALQLVQALELALALLLVPVLAQE
jgi:hypothetical protein